MTIISIALSTSLAFVDGSAPANFIHVDPAATGTNNGSSSGSACTKPSQALSPSNATATATNDNIPIAQGIYHAGQRTKQPQNDCKGILMP